MLGCSMLDYTQGVIRMSLGLLSVCKKFENGKYTLVRRGDSPLETKEGILVNLFVIKVAGDQRMFSVYSDGEQNALWAEVYDGE